MTDRRQRRGFLRRVEGAVRQLLAIDTGGNPIEQPDDPLPLGVRRPADPAARRAH